MELSAYWIFLLASIGVTIAPGPDNLFVLAQGISQRRSLALMAAWGMVSGVSVHTTLAALGISALLYSSNWAFFILKTAGACYLFYLAFLAFKGRNEMISISDSETGSTLFSMYRRGFLMNVLNPKVGIFFLAFLPQFVNPEISNRAFQMMVLGVVFMAQAFIIFSLIALFSVSIGNVIRRHASMNKSLSITTAVIFAVLGIKLILETA